MKHIIMICTALISISAMNGCQKLSDGTGILKVEVPVFYFESEVRVYPYGSEDSMKPLHTVMAVEGKSQSFTFRLNVGNYIVNHYGVSKTVQIQEGEEVTVHFHGHNDCH